MGKLSSMKNKLLLPVSFKAIGFVLLLLSIALFIAWNNFDFQFRLLQTGPLPEEGSISSLFIDNNLTNECIMLGALAGLVFIAFARERNEDERTTMIRLQSLQIGHYLSYAVFIAGLFTINGLPFLMCLLYFPYLLLLIFIIVFYSRLYLLPKFAGNEK